MVLIILFFICSSWKDTIATNTFQICSFRSVWFYYLISYWYIRLIYVNCHSFDILTYFILSLILNIYLGTCIYFKKGCLPMSMSIHFIIASLIQHLQTGLLKCMSTEIYLSKIKIPIMMIFLFIFSSYKDTMVTNNMSNSFRSVWLCHSCFILHACITCIML